MYLTLRSLTSLLYVIHVCRGSFTSPLIHYILCVMWLGSSHLFSCNACMQGGVNFMSLLFMNVYYIYILIVWFVFCPFVDDLTKKGRSIWRVYICMFILFSRLCKKGEKNLVSLCIYVLFGLCISLNIFMFIAMHELSGSLTLNFNPCIYNSMSFVIIKKGEIVGQRPITLVLMMINSCSYSTNDLVFI